MGLLNLFKRKKSEEDLVAQLGMPPSPKAKDDLVELPAFDDPSSYPNLPGATSNDLRSGSVKTEEKTPLFSLFKKKSVENVNEPRFILHTNQPLFISGKNYRLLLGDLTHVKGAFRDANDFALRIDEFEMDKEKSMDYLQKHAEYVQKKLLSIDAILFKER